MKLQFLVFRFSIIISFFLIVSCGQKEQVESSGKHSNPLLRAPNQAIEFDKLSPDNITESAEITISNANKLIADILAVQRRNFKNTMGAFDEVYNLISRVVLPLDLIIETNPDEVIRKAARQAQGSLRNYLFKLEINEQLFLAIKDYAGTEEAKVLSDHRKKFLKDLLLKFKKSGLALGLAQREEAMMLKATIEILGKKYNANIAECEDFLEITDNDTAGLDQNYLSARKIDSGRYKIDLSYPSLGPFMRYCKSDEMRKQLLSIYHNRAYPENIEILDSILYYRNQMANLLGYSTFAEYELEDKMAKTPAIVWAFENSLIEMLTKLANQDYEKLLKTKSEYTGKQAKKIEMWETAFYSRILKEKEYKLDNRKIKEYFELSNVIEGLFTITQKLLGLRYEEIKDASVWHEDVKAYNCYDVASDKLLGRFYLDLFPRDNKYSHAAMFTISSGGLLEDGGYEMPEASLVCNFPKPEGDLPSLLFHGDVETFFHEFGHLLHCLVSTAELSYQSGPERVVLDFVEAPSQIYENWAWQKQTLSLFAKHYETGKMIPDDLLDKMIAAKQLNAGMDALRQMFYGSYALYIHDKYIPYQGETTTAIGYKLQKQITGFSFPEDTHFEGAFGHLIGYSSGYYSYMWSKVYAQDMWSVFEEKGAMNSELRAKYRQKVLEPSASKDAIDLVRDFLGREPNNKAMLKDLGLLPPE